MSKYTFKPIIVVVGFRRINSIKRILASLLNAQYEQGPKLIISLDNDDGKNMHIYEYCINFLWPFGEKEVIYQPRRLGLRNHILTCGDLCYKYGSVIILEEDLFVSPYFYDYAVKAIDYYKDDNQVAGIALFNYPSARVSRLPFTPIVDDSDVFFLQISCSLGQAWTVNQWDAFKKWYNQPNLEINSRLPLGIVNWPDTSWKKYFTNYLVTFNKYFVYPIQSLTTNFNDPGSNQLSNENYSDQAKLRIKGHTYKFKELNDSINVYDAFYELLPEKVKAFNSELSIYDFELDLYGQKTKESIGSEYVITQQKCRNSILQFDRALKPHEMNVILGIKGSFFSLAKTKDLKRARKKYMNEIEDVYYYYKLIHINPFIQRFMMYRLYRKLKSHLIK